MGYRQRDARPSSRALSAAKNHLFLEESPTRYRGDWKCAKIETSLAVISSRKWPRIMRRMAVRDFRAILSKSKRWNMASVPQFRWIFDAASIPMGNTPGNDTAPNPISREIGQFAGIRRRGILRMPKFNVGFPKLHIFPAKIVGAWRRGR